MDVNNQGLNLPSNLQNLDVRNELLSTEVGSGASCAYSLRDLTGSNKNAVRVRRMPEDPTSSGDTGGNLNDERIFGAQEVQAGYVEDWVNGKLDHTLPLDVATGSAGYSLRKIKSSYSGNVVRIRRSSDNVEVDVAFDLDGKVSASSAITNVAEQGGESGQTTATDLNGFLNEKLTVGTAVNGTGSFDNYTLTNVSNTGFSADNSAGETGSAGFPYKHATGDIIVIRYTVSNFSSTSSLSPVIRGTTGVGSVVGTTTGGTQILANGTRTETLTATADGTHLMFADGNQGSYTISDFEIVSHTHSAFVQTWYDQTKDLTQVSTYYNTPFTASNFAVTNATETYGTYLGRENVVKITTTAGNGQKYHQKDFGIGAGESVRFTAQIYLPSTNTTIDSFCFSEKFDVSGYDRKQGIITPAQDQWVDIDFNYIQSDDTSQRILFWDSSKTSPTANNDVTGDIIYFRNMVVTRVTKGQADAVQNTSANQPKIAESGALLSDGLLFDGTNDSFEATDITDVNFPATVVSVSETNSTGTNRALYSLNNDSNACCGFYRSTNKYAINNGTTTVEGSATYTTDVHRLKFDLFNGASSAGFSNAVSDISGDIGTQVSQVTHFRIAGSLKAGITTPHSGTIKEIILYTSDQSSNRFKIESNINNYYGLYNDANETNGNFVASGTNSSFTANGKLGFTATSIANGTDGGGAIELNETVASGDRLYISFNSTKASSSGDGVALRQATGGTIASQQEAFKVGFNSFSLLANASNADFVVFRDDSGNGFTISDFKVSRIARNGFVETWYDQSDNGRDMSQTSAGQQPIIVNNGGQVKDPTNSKPSVKFGLQDDGTGGRNLRLTSNISEATTNAFTHFVVASIDRDDISNARLTGGAIDLFLSSGEKLSTRFGDNKTGYTLPTLGINSTTLLGAVVTTGLVPTLHFNDSTATLTAHTGTATPTVVQLLGENTIGGDSLNRYHLSGTMSEVILYLEDKGSDVSELKNNINTFYNLYQ